MEARHDAVTFTAPRFSPPPSVAGATSALTARSAVLGLHRAQISSTDDTADAIAFARRYLSHHLQAEPPAFHREIITLAGEHDRLAIAAPRGHAKSTLLSLIFPLWAAATRLRSYIVIVSDTATQAVDHLGNIYQELLQNDALTAAFPHLRLPEQSHYRAQRVKRTVGDFITVGGVRFSAKGANAGLRGMRHGSQRPDLIIGDDLENDENVATPLQREKLHNWFTKSLSNLFGADGGQLIVAGTILHRSSLLAGLVGKDAPSTYTRRLYRAIDGGALLWPEWWTQAKLEAKRADIGSRAFASEYLNDPADDSLTLFKEAWITPHRLPAAPVLARVVVAIDPSISGQGDACGIVAAGIGQDKRRYVLEDATVQASPAVWARAALDCARRMGASALVAEGNQGGEMIEQTLRSVLREGEQLPRVIVVHASRSKQARAEPIAAQYERGDVSHIGTLGPLEDELLTWVPGLPSPNRMDALVWALTELSEAPPQFRMFAV